MIDKWWDSLYRGIINPVSDQDLGSASEHAGVTPATLWLLGKTGAGKSSLIQALTGESAADIGNGFKPCTKTTRAYDFPNDHPWVRFLDTRGLGEVSYNPEQDITELQSSSHAIAVVARLDDPVQKEVCDALVKIRRHAASIRSKDLVVVHTFLEIAGDARETQRQLETNQKAFETAWGNAIDYRMVDLSEPSELDPSSLDDLKSLLVGRLPDLYLWLHEQASDDARENNFIKHKSEILWYSGAAAASDLIPAAGLITVPSLQAKMLHSLANRHGIEWDKRTFLEFVGTIGTGAGLQYGLSLGARQLAKFVPVYGQSVGAAVSSAMSFSVTYALGRVAAYYLYMKEHDQPIEEGSLGRLYKDALRESSRVKKDSV